VKLKTYQAWTMGEALDFVKSDLGADAVILHTRTFERGGFFGIGKRTVVEITAARSVDMPGRPARSDSGRGSMDMKAGTPGIMSSAAAAGDQGSRPGQAPAGHVSAGRGRDGHESHRAAAAARAYGVQAPAEAPQRGADHPLDMDAEREKTRRWAQAMAVALERSGAERASAGVNEHAVREVAAQQRPLETARAESREPLREDGPAQRFALVVERGASQEPSAPGATSPGATRLTAALVRADMPGPATASTTATSISPTHSSTEFARGLVETKPDAPGEELHEISDFIGRVLKRGGGSEVQSIAPSAPRPAPTSSTPGHPAAPARPAAFDAVLAALREQDLDEELALRVVSDAARQLESVPAPSEESVRAAVLERLVESMPADRRDPFEMLPGRHGARRIAFVGPTGVGKTTTLAKIAAQLKLKRGLRVGIVAADTYRIAAVDQLRMYAEILGLPVEIASSPRDAARACESLADVDVILIDTAGRSQNDHMKLSELRAFLASAEPDETQLVLSATAGPRALARETDAFGAVGIDRIVLTKLDEAATFGPLVGLVAKLGKSVSFLTHGQEVPDHIEFGRSRRLASLVLGSEVR